MVISGELKKIQECFSAMAAVSNEYPSLREALEPGLDKLSNILLENQTREARRAAQHNIMEIGSEDWRLLIAAVQNINKFITKYPELDMPLETAATIVVNTKFEVKP